ncbi:MAG: ABC transporter permease [Thermomicrobiales bacterium]|nr:ABC transporter permease [Thermomicrobiales bacterium]
MIKEITLPTTGATSARESSLVTSIRETLIFAYRSTIKSLRTPESFLDITLMPVMFTLMFTFLFGGAVAGSIKDYLPIIIPGILIQTGVTSSSTAGTQLREDADKAVANRFKAMPITRISPLAGTLTADILRYTIAGSIVFIMGYILGFRPDAGFWTVPVSILFMTAIGWCLSWMFSFFALSASSTATAASYGMIIMFPLTFLSNAFVDTSTMPHALGYFAEHINPISHTIAAVRELLMQGTIGSNFWSAIAGVLVILAIFVPLTLRKYTRRG